MTTHDLLPPLRFATVADDIYRGAYPTLGNYRFLRRLQLKTIISLTPEPPVLDLTNYCAVHDITNHHVAVDKYKESVELPAAEVARLLEIMIDPSSLPLYIHCLNGAHITGLVVACLRRLQNLHIDFIFAEFLRYAGKYEKCEKMFVDNFVGPICIPLTRSIPPWLWEGRRIRQNEHPYIQVVEKPVETTPNKTSRSGEGELARAKIAEILYGEAVRSGDRRSLAYYDTLLCPMGSEVLLESKAKAMPKQASVMLQALAVEGLTMVSCEFVRPSTRFGQPPNAPTPLEPPPRHYEGGEGEGYRGVPVPQELLFLDRIGGVQGRELGGRRRAPTNEDICDGVEIDDEDYVDDVDDDDEGDDDEGDEDEGDEDLEEDEDDEGDL